MWKLKLILLLETRCQTTRNIISRMILSSHVTRERLKKMDIIKNSFRTLNWSSKCYAKTMPMLRHSRLIRYHSQTIHFSINNFEDKSWDCRHFFGFQFTKKEGFKSFKTKDSKIWNQFLKTINCLQWTYCPSIDYIIQMKMDVHRIEISTIAKYSFLEIHICIRTSFFMIPIIFIDQIVKCII